MSVTIPDPRFEAPELLEPGRKPVGNIVIDWDNKNTDNLQGALLFTEAVNHLPFNYARNEFAKSSYLDRYSIEVHAGKMLATTVSLLTSFIIYDVESATQSFSVIARLWVNNVGVDLGITATGAQAPQIWLDTISSTLRIGIYAGSANYSATILTASDIPAFITIGVNFRWNGSAWLADTYVNGIKKQSGVSIGSNTSTTERIALATTGGHSKAALLSGGTVRGEYWYSWENMNLSDTQHAEIALNPYQLLIPA